jgi:hypothetical protein
LGYRGKEVTGSMVNFHEKAITTYRPNFLAIAARALAYFEDAEQQPMPRMYIDVQMRLMASSRAGEMV